MNKYRVTSKKKIGKLAWFKPEDFTNYTDACSFALTKSMSHYRTVVWKWEKDGYYSKVTEFTLGRLQRP